MTFFQGQMAFQKVIYSRESAIHSFSYPNIHSFYYECRKGTFLPWCFLHIVARVKRVKKKLKSENSTLRSLPPVKFFVRILFYV